MVSQAPGQYSDIVEIFIVSEHKYEIIVINISKNLMRKVGFLCGLAGKESSYNAGDPGSIPGLGRSPGEGRGYSLQYSGLENSMDYIVHGVPESQT